MSDIADLFHQLTFGVYVIGVADGEHRDAFTASWVWSGRCSDIVGR